MSILPRMIKYMLVVCNVDGSTVAIQILLGELHIVWFPESIDDITIFVKHDDGAHFVITINFVVCSRDGIVKWFQLFNCPVI